MAQKSSSQDPTHIILNIPRTALLLASMREGLARRGAYTDAIAHEFSRADGQSDIDDMHRRAVVKITKKYGDEQTPEMRSTLRKKLVLGRKQRRI